MKKRIIILVVSMLFLTGGINVLKKSVYAQDELETISITYTDNLTITLREITAAEINELKQKIGVYEEGKNYNVIINGYYTGLRPPTEEEWNQMEEEGLIVDDISFLGVLPSSVDHTKDPWFPPIGRQNAGSCTCWAVAYYVKTYQEAKEHGWDLSGAEWVGGRNGQPSPEYQDKIMSPDFIYHQINWGVNKGSWFADAIDVIYQIGVCSWKEMPQNSGDDHYYSFPSESAWREAPLYRGDSEMIPMSLNSNIGIDKLKKYLATDRLAVTMVDAYEYPKLNKDDLWTLDNYNPLYDHNNENYRHANTIVGYDDNFGAYTEGGKTHYGAFKIANSHGKGFSGDHNKDGCYWISYEAMKQCVVSCWYFDDKIDYEPQLLSVLQIDHPVRNDCDVTLGLNITEKDGFYLPTKPKTFSFFKAGNWPFPNNKIVLDITEFTDRISEIEGEKFFLKVYERGGVVYVLGTLTHFSVEYYDDYDSGIPTITAISEDPPIETVGNSEVIAEVVVPSSNVSLYTDKQTYSIGENVTIALENNEDEAIYFATSSHWSIQKDVNGNWETIIPKGVLPQVITQLDSGEKEESTWNQKDADGVQVGSGDYRVVVTYSMDDWTYTFTKYAYFSIGGNVISPLFVNIDRSIYAPDENVSIIAQNIGTDALSLKKWYVEKKTPSGTWETVYESSIFSDYVLLPINDTFVVTIPYNGTIVTVPPDETVIDLPNATISIWGNDTVIIGNWTTIAPLIGNQSSGISITDSISNGNITGWIIETPVINWSGGSSGWINYTTVTNGNTTGTNNNLIIGKELTFVHGENLAVINGEKWTYPTSATMLLPNQKLTWTWPQITFDGDAPGFGVYRVKIEYGDKHVCSESFSIAYYLQFKESYLIEGSSLNETPLIVFNLSETPSLVTDELSFPDSIYLYDGFLIDYENDETYDAFQSLVYEKRTDVKQDDNENYLIDADGDGNWDYIYDPVAGTTTFLKEEETVTPETSWIMIVGAVIAIAIIAIVVFLYKKKNISKKD